MAPLCTYTQHASPRRAAHGNSGIYSILHGVFSLRFSLMSVKTAKEHTGDGDRGSTQLETTIQFHKYLLSIYSEPGTFSLLHVATSVVTLQTGFCYSKINFHLTYKFPELTFVNFPLRNTFNIVDTAELDLTRVDMTENWIIRELAWFAWDWERVGKGGSVYIWQESGIRFTSASFLVCPLWSGSLFISFRSPTHSLSCHHPILHIKPDTHSLPLCLLCMECPFLAQLPSWTITVCVQVCPSTLGVAGGQRVNPIHIFTQKEAVGRGQNWRLVSKGITPVSNANSVTY